MFAVLAYSILFLLLAWIEAPDSFLFFFVLRFGWIGLVQVLIPSSFPVDMIPLRAYTIDIQYSFIIIFIIITNSVS